ncbi:Hexosaminidase D [Toxocara canis]|uniref:Hexosaminidase D n=1 Tax=Toxocara canis TaxID=6265 RepID=A0A0B2V6Z9_TOXCA|nr:Hexosaminidase D [Toxocara canis]
MLHDYEVGNHIEPVVWDYSETLQQQNEYSWRAMAASFRNIWGSSAYKGANNPSAQLLDIQHYVRNNKAWLNHKLVSILCDICEQLDVNK